MIARPVYGDSNEALDLMLPGFESLEFSNAIKAVEIEWASPVIDIFDSAWPDARSKKEVLSIDVEPGVYTVLTQELRPDGETFS